MLVMALMLQIVQKASPERSAAELRLLKAVRRWDQRVTSPAMGLAWVLGVALIYVGGWHAAGWLLVKLVFVLLLSALHGLHSGYLRRLADVPEQEASAMLKYSGPLTIAAIVIIAVMVVAKPF